MLSKVVIRLGQPKIGRGIIEVDGKPVAAVKRIELFGDVGRVPEVRLTILASEVDIEAEAEVVREVDGAPTIDVTSIEDPDPVLIAAHLPYEALSPENPCKACGRTEPLRPEEEGRTPFCGACWCPLESPA